MPAPTIETLPISSWALICAKASPASGVEGGARPVEVFVGDGEGDLGEPPGGGGLVLDDHVDVDVGVGERLEDARGGARLVGDAERA